MTVFGPREGESSLSSMRYGLQTQPARLVRGSSRRIMTMRFRPANIRVINRRASSTLLSAVLFQTEGSKAHHQERVPGGPPVEGKTDTGTVLTDKGTLRRYAPLSAARRSGHETIATGGSTQELFVAGV